MKSAAIPDLPSPSLKDRGLVESGISAAACRFASVFPAAQRDLGRLVVFQSSIP